MLRTVLWIAAACAAVLLALAVSRWMNFDEAVAPKAAEAPMEPDVAPAVIAPPIAPAPPPEAKPAPTPDEIQIQEDAAATGMTTVEPDEPPEPPTN